MKLDTVIDAAVVPDIKSECPAGWSYFQTVVFIPYLFTVFHYSLFC